MSIAILSLRPSSKRTADPTSTEETATEERLAPAEMLRQVYDNGEYTRMQFLRAVSHSIMHTQPLQIQDDGDDKSDPAAHAVDEDTASVTTSTDSSATSDRCEVCLLQPRSDVALVPCGHLRATCADIVASMDSGSPIIFYYALNTYTHGTASSCVTCVPLSHRVDSARRALSTARIRIRITDKRALANLLQK